MIELKNIPISNIGVVDRARTSFGDIDILAKDIEQNGLICPIAIKDNGEGTYTLLAGHRRLKACKQLNWNTIPARIYSDELTEHDSKCIELAENILRKDLSWDEQADLIREIHSLMLQTHPDWSQQKTADLLHMSKANINHALQLSEAVEKIPVLRKFDNADSARRMLKQASVHLDRIKLIDTTDIPLKAQELDNWYIIGDFLDESKKLSDNIVDFCEVDWPFSIDLHDKKRATAKDKYSITTMKDYVEISNDYELFMNIVLSECFRIMKSHAWILIWFAPEPWFQPTYDAIIKAGFRGDRIPGIWRKGIGQTNHPELYFSRSYEMFFYARKGDPSLLKQGRDIIFDYPRIAAQYKVHPTEKPIELYDELISIFCPIGGLILSPFLGSGNVLLSAYKQKCKAFGYDLSESFKQTFTEKLIRL